MENNQNIDLKTALEQTGRIKECCVHCGAPLFYDIDGVLVKIVQSRIIYSPQQLKPKHLKWLIDGVRIGNTTYYRNVCWNCFYKQIRQAYLLGKWNKTDLHGWLKEVIDGSDELPPAKMSALGKNVLPLMVTDITDDDLKNSSSKYDSASIQSFVRRYGNIEGQKKYDEYVKFHSVKNTYEWKRVHKGWSKKQFDEYNKSRAITRENLIKRYGKEDGEKRFDSYCKWQAYAGCAVEYFKDLYGEDEGEKRYKEVNSKKSLNLNNFIEKYGEYEGQVRWERWHKQASEHGYKLLKEILNRPYSSISQKLFSGIINRLSDECKKKCRFATHGGEVKIMLKNGNIAQPDFIMDQKIIEFNGDYWHRNPQIYKDDLVTEDTKSIWMADADRIKSLNELGYSVLIVWELDYNKDPEGVLETCLDFLYENRS